MRHHGLIVLLTIICQALAAPRLEASDSEKLRGPIETQGSTALPDKDAADIGGLSAPGAEAVMTPDFLLLSPQKGTKPAQALSAFIGMSLKIDLEPKQIQFENLHGLKVTVTNDTNRALLVDGDSAGARLGEKTINCASLTDLQLAVSPEHGPERAAVDLLTKVAPAAASIGVIPTVKDIIKFSGPVPQRYGKDEERREAEASRFGKRILWPHEKTEGIVYFKTAENLDAAKLEIPVSTLFDKTDRGTLISSP